MKMALLALAAPALLVCPRPAQADVFGGDVPVLTGILVQATQTVSQLNESLQTAKRAYEEARRIASYADEAAEAYRQFGELNAELSRGDVGGLLDQAFPEAASLRDEARRLGEGGRWAEGSGELRRMVQVCLRVGQCTQVREALSVKQTREALDTVFGPSPAALSELQAVDSEVAVAVAASTAQEGRGAVSRAYAAELMRQCQRQRQGGGNSALAACQAAAAAADIAKLESDADVGDAVSQGNRLQALQLALESQARKRDLVEAQERRDVLLEGAKHLAGPPVNVQTEGFDVLGEGAGAP